MRTASLQLTRTLGQACLALWLTSLVLIPIILVFLISFATRSDSHNVTWSFTLSNYWDVWQWPYLKVLGRSVWLSMCCTFFCLLLGFPAAFILARFFKKHRGILLLLLLIPFWTSTLVRTYGIMGFIKAQGPLSKLLLHLHIIKTPLALMYTNTAVLITCVYNLLPFMILPLITNLEKIDNHLYEAARDLGANSLERFKRITLPLARPGILAGVILVFFPAMTLFYIPNLVGGARSLLLGNLIENQFLSFQNWPGGATTSVLFYLFMLVCIVCAKQLFQKPRTTKTKIIATTNTYGIRKG